MSAGWCDGASSPNQELASDPVKAELALNDLVPPDERGAFSLRMILHGRQVCDARRPRCDVCLLNDICPSAFKV